MPFLKQFAKIWKILGYLYSSSEKFDIKLLLSIDLALHRKRFSRCQCYNFEVKVNSVSRYYVNPN